MITIVKKYFLVSFSYLGYAVFMALNNKKLLPSFFCILFSCVVMPSEDFKSKDPLRKNLEKQLVSFKQNYQAQCGYKLPKDCKRITINSENSEFDMLTRIANSSNDEAAIIESIEKVKKSPIDVKFLCLVYQNILSFTYLLLQRKKCVGNINFLCEMTPNMRAKITYLVVHEHTSSGFGRYLLGKARALLLSLGAFNISLEAMPQGDLTMAALVRFYSSMGFCIEKVMSSNGVAHTVDMRLSASKNSDGEMILKKFDVKQELLDYARNSYCTDVSIVF